MARAHGIAVLAIILVGTGTWFAFALLQDRSLDPLPGTAGGPEGPTTRAPAAPEHGEGGRTAVPGARPPADTPAAPKPAPAPVAPDGEPPPTVRLQVLDEATRQPLPAFRWRFRGGGDTPLHGDGKDGAAALPLPRGAHGDLLVEADAHQPHEQAIDVPGLGDPLPVLVFLQATSVQTGIELHLRALDSTPVGGVRIEAWKLQDEENPTADTEPQREPLWTRRAEQPDGVYRLPDLAPGRWFLCVQAWGKDGPEPFLPWRTLQPFASGDAVRLDPVLQPGTVLTIAATDAQARARELEVLVRGPDGSARRGIPWRTVTTTGSVLRLDRIALPGVVTLQHALPLGDYGLELRDGDLVLAAPRSGTAPRFRFDVVLPP